MSREPYADLVVDGNPRVVVEHVKSTIDVHLDALNEKLPFVTGGFHRLDRALDNRGKDTELVIIV